MRRPHHVRPVTPAARHRWRELHEPEPADRVTVAILGAAIGGVLAIVAFVVGYATGLIR